MPNSREPMAERNLSLRRADAAHHAFAAPLNLRYGTAESATFFHGNAPIDQPIFPFRRIALTQTDIADRSGLVIEQSDIPRHQLGFAFSFRFHLARWTNVGRLNLHLALYRLDVFLAIRLIHGFAEHHSFDLPPHDTHFHAGLGVDRIGNRIRTLFRSRIGLPILPDISSCTNN